MKTLRERMSDAMVLRGFAVLQRESICQRLPLPVRQGIASAASPVRHPDGEGAQIAPCVLSRDEVSCLLAAAPNPRARALLMATYAAGLRVTEVCSLQLADIESAPDRMCIKVRGGKGGKDRYTLLSPVLLQTLRNYWHLYHPRTWLFPNHAGTEPICATLAQRMYYVARDRAKLGRHGGIHTLRHCFATHLLESGVDIHTIQRLLGHGHVSTTMRYFHLAQNKLTGTTSPLELLDTVLR